MILLYGYVLLFLPFSSASYWAWSFIFRESTSLRPHPVLQSQELYLHTPFDHKDYTDLLRAHEQFSTLITELQNDHKTNKSIAKELNLVWKENPSLADWKIPFLVSHPRIFASIFFFFWPSRLRLCNASSAKLILVLVFS